MTKIDKEWVKKAIAKKYSSNWKEQLTRELKIIKLDKKNERVIFFILCGTPPKGYAIYQPDHHFITIIDAWGNKKATYQDKEYIE